MSVLLPTLENAEREQLVEAELGRAVWLDKELREYDLRLCLTRVHENVPKEYAEALGMVPGYWHVKLKNAEVVPPIPDFYWPITGPNGEYREPDAHVMVEVKNRHVASSAQFRDLIDRRDKRQKAKTRQRALEREQRVDTIAQDIRAAKRVSGDGGLTRRMWGKS